MLVPLSAGTAWLLPPWIAALPLAALAFVLWFFRDPERRTPEDPRALIAPADGRIIRADARRLSIFMNVFNVHVCRSPLAGTVVSLRHSPGRFMAAFHDAASEHNERTEIALQGERVPLRFVLVAGLVARRIVCKVEEGQPLRAGQRVGVIQFGSRVDVDLPPGAEPRVAVGDRVKAGETIVARLGDGASAEDGGRTAPEPES